MDWLKNNSMIERRRQKRMSECGKAPVQCHAVPKWKTGNSLEAYLGAEAQNRIKTFVSANFQRKVFTSCSSIRVISPVPSQISQPLNSLRRSNSFSQEYSHINQLPPPLSYVHTYETLPILPTSPFRVPSLGSIRRIVSASVVNWGIHLYDSTKCSHECPSEMVALWSKEPLTTCRNSQG